MTPMQVRTAIQVKFLDEFNGLFPIALDNQDFKPPNADGANPDLKWARLQVSFDFSNQSSLGRPGNRRYERLGIAFIQCHTSSDTGSLVNDQLVNEVLELYEGTRIDDLWFDDARVITDGTDGPWYKQTVIINFTFEHIR